MFARTAKILTVERQRTVRAQVRQTFSKVQDPDRLNAPRRRPILIRRWRRPVLKHTARTGAPPQASPVRVTSAVAVASRANANAIVYLDVYPCNSIYRSAKAKMPISF